MNILTETVLVLSKLVSSTYVQTCEKCSLTTYKSIVVHKMCFCSGTTDERSSVWSLYRQHFGIKASRELLGMTPSAQFRHIVKMALNLTDNLELVINAYISICLVQLLYVVCILYVYLLCLYV